VLGRAGPLVGGPSGDSILSSCPLCSVCAATISAQERSVFSHTLSEGASHGVITHWWITGGLSTDFAVLRFYIDGEASASIVLQPGMACGVGFDDDTQAPWSNTWFGKGAKSGGWFNNMRIPFQASINVTYTAGPGQPNDSIYMIVSVSVRGLTARLCCTSRVRGRIFASSTVL